MPYIPNEDRLRSAMSPSSAGELNFAITNLVINYIKTKTDSAPLNYALLNEVVGAMQSSKDEFVRRVVGPYEDKCIAKNGDVYPAALSPLEILKALAKPGIPSLGTKFGLPDKRETCVVLYGWSFMAGRGPGIYMLYGRTKETTRVSSHQMEGVVASVDSEAGIVKMDNGQHYALHGYHNNIGSECRYQIPEWLRRKEAEMKGTEYSPHADAYVAVPPLAEIAAAPADNEASLRVFVPEPPIVAEPERAEADFAVEHHNDSAAGAEFPMRRDELPVPVCVEAPSAEDYPIAEPMAEEDDRIPF